MLGVLNESDGSFAHFCQVERANGAGKTHRNARVGRNQNVGKTGGKQHRLFGCSVVVVHHINSVFVDTTEQFLANEIQLDFGITGGGIGHFGILFAKASFGINERMKQGFVSSGQADQRFINGTISVGIQFHGLPHHVGGFDAVAGQ